MIWLCIFGVILSGIFNGSMDTLNFRWWNSIFEKIEENKRWGFFVPPHDSWENKHEYKGLLGYLMRGPLAFLTDGWHLFQFLSLSLWQIPFAFLIANYFFTGAWWEVLIAFGLLKIFYGGGFYVGWN